MKQMVKLGLILAAYAVISCFCLAIVNNLTAPVIAQHDKDALSSGLREVFTDADHFSDPLAPASYTAAANGTIKNAYQVFGKDNAVIGAVIELEGKTYDHADILAGFKNDADLTMTGMKFLVLTDSPGFGQKAQDPSYLVKSGKTFFGQFSGMKASAGFTLGKTFDGISGATITSKSVGLLMQQAAATAGEVLGNSSIAAPDKERTTVFTVDEALKELFSGENLTISKDADSSVAAGIPAAGTIVNNMRIESTYVIKTAAGKMTGAAVLITGASYHGPATVLAGVDANRVITGARIIALNDTPSLGMQALGTMFYSQFTGKSVDQTFVPGKDFDALSGATITSASIADMVKVGAEEAAKIMAANGGAPAPSGAENYTLNNLQPEE
jgi:Na+-translocating ferredoxin:NAD+ oxidoreductase subunit G